MHIKADFVIICLQLLITISLPSCYSTYQDDGFSVSPYGFRRTNRHYHPLPHHTFGSFEQRQHRNYGSVSRNLYRHRNSVAPMRRSRAHSPKHSPNVINVDDFGARGDGNDDSQAFNRAWKAACSSSGGVVLVVPRNKVYLLNPVTFSGPCRSQSIVFKIYGTIKASKHRSNYKDRRYWLVFQNVNNLRVDGGGRIDGNGKIWWQNSCKINKNLPCVDAPTALTFMECNNVVVSSIGFRNAQQMHLTFNGCFNVRALNLEVTAPGNSPNTDGIHVTGTQNILINNCVIRTGDDCISIVSGSKNVRATGITCGPGHGISIGSLGAGNSEGYVSNVLVSQATLLGTTNGVRIKTWQGGHGFARNIIFQDVMMKNVTNPIIIDQNYCDKDQQCHEQASAVQISDVLYRNIRGTSSSDVAVKFDCSRSIPCRGILMQNVNLWNQEDDEVSKAACTNVRLDTRGSVNPRCA